MSVRGYVYLSSIYIIVFHSIQNKDIVLVFQQMLQMSMKLVYA